MASSVKARQEDIPGEVYIRFVRSLFDNAYVLLIGAACHTIMAIAVFARTDNRAYLLIAAALSVVGVWRYLGILSFHRSGGVLSNVADARQWELSYILKGGLQGLVLGSFCFVSIYVYPDAFAELTAMSVTLGSLVTVVGRNYGSPRMVGVFASTFIGPAAVALLLRLDWAHITLGLMIIPMTFLTIASAAHVRNVLFSAVTGHNRAKLLAARFDRALNTMPQGLIMFDAEGAAVVANAEAVHFLGVTSTDALIGRSMRAILGRVAAAGLIDADQCNFASIQLASALKNGTDRKLEIALVDGRFFELSAREGDNNLGVVMFEDVTSRVRVDRKIGHMARYDNLTSLPNRTFFHESAAARLASGDPNRSCALAIFDLDDFKAINDSYGHPIGDKVIEAIGAKLSALQHENLIIGRFGGDEFVVYIDRAETGPSVFALADELLATLGGEMEVDGNVVSMQASGGLVVLPAISADVDKMIVKADLALQSAKVSGKGRWRAFEPSLERAFRERQTLKADLRAAVSAGALRVVYQPIVSVTTMKMAGCEALCRWDHKDLGPISPATFIPLAEETGIIRQITAFVLDQACRECAKWPEPMSVAVNLSALDFRDRSVVSTVIDALNGAGLAASRLEIEVTETALLDDKSATREYIEQLRDFGVRIALDDFGTGYSSLSYLHRLPLDKVKIDRSFLVDISDNERSLKLLDGVARLSHSLGIEVTVEGVETFEQLRILSDHVQPELAQGFLFGAALTASGIRTMSNTVWPFEAAPRKLRPALMEG